MQMRAAAVLATITLTGCQTYVVTATVSPPPTGAFQAQVTDHDLAKAKRIVREVASVAKDPVRCKSLDIEDTSFRMLFMCTISHPPSLTNRDRTNIWVSLAHDKTSLVFWIRDFRRGEESELVSLMRGELERQARETFPRYVIEIRTRRMRPPS